MSPFDLVALFLCVVGVAGWINVRWLRWPSAAVMVLAGLLCAGLLLVLRTRAPDTVDELIGTIRTVDFPKTVLGYMLAFLLFAGAMQVNLQEMRRRFAAIASLSTLGVFVSTAVVGFGLWAAARGLGLPLDLGWALVFGALISPTDPIAVLAAVREGSLSKTLESVLQGEALFNDGVGIVVFTAALAIATGGEGVAPADVLLRVAVEALGGALVGAVGGLVVIRAMRAIDDYSVEVGLSIALAMGAYALSSALEVSGPIAVVVAGLLVGDRGMRTAMSDTTQRYVRGFWTLVDEILNALLFLLLGLELLVVPLNATLAGLAVAAVLLVLVARLAVVLPWGAYFHFRRGERGASLLLAWGGLHGALSLALALSLPAGPMRDVLLALTFAVVITSVLAQGLTFGRLAARLAPDDPPEA